MISENPHLKFELFWKIVRNGIEEPAMVSTFFANPDMFSLKPVEVIKVVEDREEFPFLDETVELKRERLLGLLDVFHDLARADMQSLDADQITDLYKPFEEV